MQTSIEDNPMLKNLPPREDPNGQGARPITPVSPDFPIEIDGGPVNAPSQVLVGRPPQPK